jgi:hypothetical protein
MASHIPVNHRMRGFWRVLATLAGLYVLLAGIVGLSRTSGMATFATHGKRVLAAGGTCHTINAATSHQHPMQSEY